jgi:LAO/AO transport system kinase
VERELKMALMLAEKELEWTPPVVRTVASKGEGIDELLASVADHRAYLTDENAARNRLRLKYGKKFQDLLAEGFLRRLKARWLSPEEEARLVEGFVRREGDPYSAVESILAGIRWEEKP